MEFLLLEAREQAMLHAQLSEVPVVAKARERANQVADRGATHV
jgi:hypothetical protein